MSLFKGFYEADLFDCPPFQMFTAGDCPRSIEILDHRSFEPTSMRLWCALVPGATSIVDVGAHVGVYSLAAAALRGEMPVHAFEPNPYAFSRLRIHKNLNDFHNIVEHSYAAWNEAGVTTFSWHQKPNGFISSGGSLANKYPNPIVCRTGRLDQEDIAWGARPLMKIDVEGGEVGVILGMAGVFKYRPDIILESFDPGNCKAIWSVLGPIGYKAYEIEEDSGRIEPLPMGLRAADPKGKDYNQFLTVHPLPILPMPKVAP